MVVTPLQADHQGLAGDSAKLVGEGAVKNQDVHGEDPLTDGCSVLQDEALMDEEDSTWGARVKEGKYCQYMHKINKHTNKHTLLKCYKHF